MESLKRPLISVTIDAMGTQTAIAEQFVEQKGYYVLEVKGNQKLLYEDIFYYFAIEDEKARGQIETREYYQTQNIKWLKDKERWSSIKSIGMVKTTKKKKEDFISSIKEDIEEFS